MSGPDGPGCGFNTLVRLKTAVAPYVAAAILLLPVGGCLAWSSASAEKIGLQRSDEDSGLTAVFGPGCARSAEGCELP